MLHILLIEIQDGMGRENGEDATLKEYLPRIFQR